MSDLTHIGPAQSTVVLPVTSPAAKPHNELWRALAIIRGEIETNVPIDRAKIARHLVNAAKAGDDLAYLVHTGLVDAVTGPDRPPRVGLLQRWFGPPT